MTKTKSCPTEKELAVSQSHRPQNSKFNR